jgi:hypothetical protein
VCAAVVSSDTQATVIRATAATMTAHRSNTGRGVSVIDPASAATAAAWPLGQLVVVRARTCWGSTTTCACFRVSHKATATSTEPTTPRIGRSEALTRLRIEASAQPSATRSGIQSLNS